MARLLLWVFFLLCLWSSLTVMASSSLLSSLEATVAMNPSALGPRQILLPDTLLTATLSVRLEGLLVKGVARFDLDGLDYLAISAASDSESLSWDSAVAFHPLGETKAKTKAVTKPVQLYDWGQEYFVDSLVAENIDATSGWFIRTSADNSTWTAVTGIFDPHAHASGSVPVNTLVRYVEVRATTGVLKASRSSPQKLTITYSNRLWKTSFTILAGSITFVSTIALSLAGSAYASLAVSCQEDSSFSPNASVKFGLQKPSGSLCFQQGVLEADLSIGCTGKLTAKVEADEAGFGAFSLVAKELPTGLPWLTLSGSLTLAVLTTELELKPEVALEDGPCFSLHAKALTDTLGTEITGISFYGVGMSYSCDRLRISSLSYLDGAHHISVLGSQSCSEAVTVATSADSCCGGLIQVKCSVCFSASSNSFFEWSETDVLLSVGTTASTLLSVSVAVETVGVTYLAVTCLVEW